MAIRKFKKTEKESINEKKKVAKRPNWILRFTLLIIIIPVFVLAFILITSMEKAGQPVVGSRFDGQLNPAIKDSEVKKIEDSLKSDAFDKVEVQLKSATLRISIDTKNEIDQAGVEAIANDVYTKVTAVLPVDTYFTNQLTKDSTIKMYDMEINVYNYIPDDTNRAGWIKCVLHKNATEEEAGMDWPSIPRDEEVTNQVKGQAAASQQ